MITIAETRTPETKHTALVSRSTDNFDVINARVLQGFGQLCSACGGNAAELLAQVGIETDAEKTISAPLTYRQFVRLMAEAARSFACPDFGMRLALAQSGTDLYGPLGSIMRNSRTLGEALDYVTRHSSIHSRAAKIAKFSIPETNGVVFSHEIIVGSFEQQIQAMEYMLLAGHLGARALTHSKVRARKVLLQHQAVSQPAIYRRNFGCEVQFDQLLNGLIFSHEDLACAVVGQDQTDHADLIATVEASFTDAAPPIHAAARGVVLRLMHVGLASNALVAAELGLHTRTLHRRLIEAGTTFQEIKNKVRCELARYYLVRTDVSLLWITGKLGFAEQAVFTRFCQHHFKCSPGAMRKEDRLTAQLTTAGASPSRIIT